MRSDDAPLDISELNTDPPPEKGPAAVTLGVVVGQVRAGMSPTVSLGEVEAGTHTCSESSIIRLLGKLPEEVAWHLCPSKAIGTIRRVVGHVTRLRQFFIMLALTNC